MADRVTSEALQVHSDVGYTTDLTIERYWGDARLTKFVEDTSEIELGIVSDRVRRRRARSPRTRDTLS